VPRRLLWLNLEILNGLTWVLIGLRSRKSVMLRRCLTNQYGCHAEWSEAEWSISDSHSKLRFFVPLALHSEWHWFLCRAESWAKRRNWSGVKHPGLSL
jgi:hypothetical protein